MVETLTSLGSRSHKSGEHNSCINVREHDRYLPIANISWIMKKELPTITKIANYA